jgi:carboxyl-terminal processing protease
MLAVLTGWVWVVSGSGTVLMADSKVAESQRAENLATFDMAWRILHENYFDPEFQGMDWEAIRKELRPRAAAAGEAGELRKIIQGMLDQFDESHMAIIPRGIGEPGLLGDDDDGGSGDAEVGLEVRLMENQVVVRGVEPGGAAEMAGIKPGWILKKIGGRSLEKPVADAIAELGERRAHFIIWRMVDSRLQGRAGSKVQLELQDEKDRLVEVELRRNRPLGEPVQLGHFPIVYTRFESDRLKMADGMEVGWIRFNLWMIPAALQFDRAVDQFRDADGMILDLRGNLGGIAGMIMGLSGHFLDERLSLGTMKMRDGELRLLANPRRVNPAGKTVRPYEGPLAILIDNLSLSAAEIFAGGMQNLGRARIFGETSGGQALPAVFHKLPNGDLLYTVFADFVTPSGVRLEKRGVVPDVMEPLSREDLLEGKDAALLAAQKWISMEAVKRSTPLEAGH